MGKITRAVEHLRVEEIDKRIKHCTQAWRMRRWQVIRCALVHPKPASEIALELGLARQTVHNFIAAYNRYGPSVLESPGRGQRQRAYLSLAQEQAMLTPFLERSVPGHLSTVLEIKAALEKAVGHPVAKNTVYRLIKRHRWRKETPRPRHPKADRAKQEAFKKLPRNGSSLSPRTPSAG